MDFALVVLVASSCSAAERVKLHKGLTADQMSCFRDLFRERHVGELSEGEINKFIGETVVGKANLKGHGKDAFIFLVHDIGYCGSAGCLMLIGERRSGKCHLLDEGDGAGAGDIIIVLNRRDHGYRRLYAPCELYYDGQQYQQVREACPTLEVER